MDGSWPAARGHRARDILRAHEPYGGMAERDLAARIEAPLLLGRAAVVSGALFVSWMRPCWGGALERIVAGETPAAGDWLEDGPLLWLVDVAAVPGMSGTWVGRQVSRLLCARGAARPGERVAFLRHGRRIGWAVARR